MKRKKISPRKVNPIIAALRRSSPGGFALAVDHPPDHVLDLLAVVFFKDAIPEIGFRVVKALLTKDPQIVRTLKDALKESDHFFKRDRELVLLKKVVKDLPDLIGLDPVARKREIEERFNCGNKLPEYRGGQVVQGVVSG